MCLSAEAECLADLVGLCQSVRWHACFKQASLHVRVTQKRFMPLLATIYPQNVLIVTVRMGKQPRLTLRNILVYKESTPGSNRR